MKRRRRQLLNNNRARHQHLDQLKRDLLSSSYPPHDLEALLTAALRHKRLSRDTHSESTQTASVETTLIADPLLTDYSSTDTDSFVEEMINLRRGNGPQYGAERDEDGDEIEDRDDEEEETEDAGEMEDTASLPSEYATNERAGLEAGPDTASTTKEPDKPRAEDLKIITEVNKNGTVVVRLTDAKVRAPESPYVYAKEGAQLSADASLLKTAPQPRSQHPLADNSADRSLPSLHAEQLQRAPVVQSGVVAPLQSIQKMINGQLLAPPPLPHAATLLQPLSHPASILQSQLPSHTILQHPSSHILQPQHSTSLLQHPPSHHLQPQHSTSLLQHPPSHILQPQHSTSLLLPQHSTSLLQHASRHLVQPSQQQQQHAPPPPHPVHIQQQPTLQPTMINGQQLMKAYVVNGHMILTPVQRIVQPQHQPQHHQLTGQVMTDTVQVSPKYINNNQLLLSMQNAPIHYLQNVEGLL